jgi:ribosomal protein S12 methylthiotransferase
MFIKNVTDQFPRKEIPNVDQYFGTTGAYIVKALGADYKHELLGERLATTPKKLCLSKIAGSCDRPCCAIQLCGKTRITNY